MQPSNKNLKGGYVLSRQQFNDIKNLAEGGDVKLQKEAVARKIEFGDYMKDASIKMTKNWKETKEREKENDIGNIILKQQDARKKEITQRYKDIVQKNEETRKALRDETTYKTHLLKMGPRQLQGAALLSEVLQTRQVQIKQQNDVQNCEKEKQKLQYKQDMAQNQQWMADQAAHNAAVKERTMEYNRSLVQDIRNRRCSSMYDKHAKIQSEIEEIKLVDKEIQTQVAREMAYMEKKREQRRMIALQAMQMAEERRLREKLQNDVEDQMLKMYNNGKREIERMRKDKQKDMRDHVYKFREQLGEATFAHSTPEPTPRAPCPGNESYKKEREEQLKQEKLAKQERLLESIKALEIDEQSKQQKAADERSFEMASRFKNNEINQQFDTLMQQERAMKTMKCRDQLISQMYENEQRRKAEAADNEYIDMSDHVKEDEYFANFARDLVMDAILKGRPLHPLFKVIKNYEKNNKLHVYPPKPNSPPIIEAEGCANPKEERVRYTPFDLKKMNPYYCLE